ncbi:unnamed protein product, partial [Brachionus calyciflorus]
ENANLAQYLDNLAQYVEFPYEYWHQSYTPDLETLYFDDIQQLEPLPSLLSIIEPIPQSMLLYQITPIYENEPFQQSEEVPPEIFIDLANDHLSNQLQQTFTALTTVSMTESNVNPQSSSRPRIADILHELDLENLEDEDFNYIESNLDK